MADAFFRFGTDIEQTAAEIRRGMQSIAADLARTRGGNVNLFDDVATSASNAIIKARRQLAGIGNQLSAGIANQSVSGGGVAFNQQYRALRAAALKEVKDVTTQAASTAGLSKTETSALVKAGQARVALEIKTLFDSIATALATDQKLTRLGFLRGGLGPSGRTANVERLLGRRGNENLVRQTRINTLDDDAVVRETALRREANDINQRRNAQLAGQAAAGKREGDQYDAVQKSIRRNAEKRLAEETTAFRTAERRAKSEITAARQQQQMETLLADPTTTFNKARTQAILGSTGQVFNVRGAGVEEEINRAKVAKAHLNNVRSIQTEIDTRTKAIQHESLTQSFLGGLTSSGFGSRATGFDASGLARSLGSTVKFSTQYAALQLVQGAIADTISEAVKYRDALTDLNVALGHGNDASASYVDSLSNISKLAGGNVSEALESAARGVRAFGNGLDAEQKKEAGLQTARAATSLSIIANKSIPDATGDIVAIGSAFGITANHLDHIVDSISAAKQQGGDPRQIAQGLASGGVALNAAGFSAAEGAQLLSRVVLQLDQSGQATATRIARITQALAGTAGRTLVRSLGLDPNSSERDQFVAIATGLANNKYNAAQQAQIKHTLGGTSNLRELQVMLDAIGHELSGGFANGFEVAGRGQKEMDRRTHNLAGELRILGGTLTNIQNELFDSGAFAPFVAALGTLQPVLGTVEELLKLFNQLAHVLPNIHLGPVGLSDALVGALEIFGVVKAIGKYQESQATKKGVLGSLNADLTAAQLSAEKAALGVGGAESAEAKARAVTVDGIKAKIVAYKEMQAAEAGAALPVVLPSVVRDGRFTPIVIETAAPTAPATDATGAPADISQTLSGGYENLAPKLSSASDLKDIVGAERATGVAEAGLFARSQARTGAFLATGLGKVTVAGIVVVSLVQAIEKLTSVIEQNSTSSRAAKAAINELSDKPVGSAIDSLSAAAAARDRASSGIVGNLFDDISKLFGGPDAEKDAKNLRIERDSEKARVKRRKDEALALSSTQGRFNDVFGDLSLDSLKAGFDELDASGASATRTIALLNAALSDVGDKERVGVIKPGSSGRIADAISDTLFTSVAGVLSGPIKAGVSADSGGNLEYFYAHRDAILARQKKDDADRKAKLLNPLSDADSLLQANLEVQREGSKTAAEDALHGVKAFSTGRISKLKDEASQLLQDKFNVQVGASGILTDAQIHEDAAAVFDLLASKDASLKKYRDAIIAVLEGNIRTKTTVGGKIISQDTANEVANQAVTRGQAARAEALDLSYNPATGESSPINADISQINTLKTTADKIKKSGYIVPDNLLLALFDSYHQLVEDRLAETKKSIAILDAKEVAGIDPRNTEAQAAAAVDAARRDLAVARPGLEFYQAQAALLKAQQAYADEVTAAQATAAFNGVNPSDTVATSAAALEANRIEGRALRRGVNPATGLRDFDAQGNPIGTAPDFVEVGKGTGEDFLKGLNLQDYFGEGKTIGEQLLAGMNTVVTPTPPTPPPTPAIPGKHSAVIGEHPDGTPIIGQVPDAAPPPPAKVTAAQLAKLPTVLAQLRQYESGSDYTAQNPTSTASGAYQYLDSTWNKYGGFLHAREAPKAVQDKRATADLMANLAKYGGDWRKVIAAHFAGAAWVDAHPDPSTWNVNPAPGTKNPTVAQYVNAVTGTKPGTDTTSSTTGGAGQKAIDENTQKGIALAQAHQRDIINYNIASLQAETDPNNSLDQARTNLRAAVATMNSEASIGTNTLAYKQAVTAARAAQLALAKAFDDRTSAREGADVARSGGGAIAHATQALTEAKRNLAAQAPRTAEYYRAQAQVYDAQRANAQAQRDNAVLFLTLGSDITNPLEQAQIALDAAKAKLKDDTAAHYSKDVLGADQLNVNQLAATAEATQFNQNLQAIQTADQLGQITHAAYLSYLKSEHDRLTAISVKTFQQQQELNTVDQAIKAANDALSSGPFNLGDIKVPTPYEVRRSIATSAGGFSLGAANSSTVNNIYINGADVAKVKATVLSIIGPTATGRTSVATSKL